MDVLQLFGAQNSRQQRCCFLQNVKIKEEDGCEQPQQQQQQ